MTGAVHGGSVPPGARPVFQDDPRLTEADFRALLGAALRRLSLNVPLGRLALVAGCDERTLRNARDGLMTLKAPSLFNLLARDPSALDELLARFGLRAVPLEQAEVCDPGLLAQTASLTAAKAAALATGGAVDHIEEQELAAMARPVVREWAARIARADKKRAGH